MHIDVVLHLHVEIKHLKGFTVSDIYGTSGTRTYLENEPLNFSMQNREVHARISPCCSMSFKRVCSALLLKQNGECCTCVHSVYCNIHTW